MSEKRCPCCGGEALRAIYAGFPVWLCAGEECHAVWGFWSWVVLHGPFNGWFFVYSGRYLPALWAWLRTPADGEGA